MAIILSFVPRKRPASRSVRTGPASIIIFPGVRYEGAGEINHPYPPAGRRNAGPKRPDRSSPAHV